MDLTRDFAPGIPRCSGFPDEQRKTIYRYDKKQGMMGDGFFAEIFTHVGQWGTHVAMLAKTFGVWMRPSTVVENMLGQLTASRGTNEDRL